MWATVDDLGVATDVPIVSSLPSSLSINLTTPNITPIGLSKYTNTTLNNTTTSSDNPVISQVSVTWPLQTPSEAHTTLVQEETTSLFQWSNLGRDTTYAVIKFPFNQSLAIASFPSLLSTSTSISGDTTINSNINNPTINAAPSIEDLPTTSGDWMINDISLNPHTDTLFLTNEYGIFTLVDNYRGALSSLPLGTAKGLKQVNTMPPLLTLCTLMSLFTHLASRFIIMCPHFLAYTLEQSNPRTNLTLTTQSTLTNASALFRMYPTGFPFPDGFRHGSSDVDRGQFTGAIILTSYPHPPCLFPMLPLPFCHYLILSLAHSISSPLLSTPSQPGPCSPVPLSCVYTSQQGSNAMLQPLITPFQEQTLQQVTYNPLVISITVKSHPCTSVTATPTETTDSGYMVGLPWYMGTVTCVLTQPGSTDIRYTHLPLLTLDGISL